MSAPVIPGDSLLVSMWHVPPLSEATTRDHGASMCGSSPLSRIVFETRVVAKADLHGRTALLNMTSLRSSTIAPGLEGSMSRNITGPAAILQAMVEYADSATTSNCPGIDSSMSKL
jgi:hypothetical protein